MKTGRITRTAILSVLSMVLLTGVLSAQTSSDAVGAYQSQMQTYKDHLKELRSLKEEYQKATPERKDEIQTQFAPLLAETAGLQKSLVPLAIDAFKAQNSPRSILTSLQFSAMTSLMRSLYQ